MRIRRWLVLARAASATSIAISAAVAGTASAEPLPTATAVTLVDNLGEANTSSRFAEEGRNGYSLAFDQSVGLQFQVTQPTVLTEVGGFVQSLPSYASEATDVIVEIHPAHPTGLPNRTEVLASAPVSAQTDPRFITYQRANFATLLQPGTYYALFALADQTPPAVSEAILLSSGLRETSPGTFVPYAAPFATGGVTHPPNYAPELQEIRLPLDVAQRILGETLLPTTKDQCKNGGWRSYGVFKNQGDCVSFVATGGRNQPSGP
jgi:hypothetical protein